MEGYASRTTEQPGGYASRDSFGGMTQRTDTQRGSYGRDQYADDARRGYSTSVSSRGPEGRSSTDMYNSPGAKRELPTKDGTSYRDQLPVDAKRGRYSDYSNSHQSSESQYQPPERRTGEQGDSYGRGPARGYTADTTGSNQSQGSYDSYSSSQYATSRYDPSSRYGAAESMTGDRRTAGSLDQSRSVDQRLFSI